MRGLRGAQLRMRVVERGHAVEQGALGFAARGRPSVGGFLGGVLRALASVQRVIEGEAIVALRDGVVGALERFLRRGELFGGVLIGAGGARRVDRALRLLDFLVGRICARRADERRSDGDREQDTTKRRHDTEYNGCQLSAVGYQLSTLGSLSAMEGLSCRTSDIEREWSGTS